MQIRKRFFKYERDYANMNEKKDRAEQNKRVVSIIKSHMAQKGLKQSDLLRKCEEKGYSLNQSELSRILSNSVSLGLYPVLALADVLEIDPSVFMFEEQRRASLLDLSPEVFAMDPEDRAVKSYLGRYSTLFHSTDVQEQDKVLHGRLILYQEHETTANRAEAYCGAYFSVDTGVKDLQGNPVLKKYRGRFIISKHLDVAYCILVNNEWGEISFIEFRHRVFYLKNVECRVGMALTVSAGEKKVPVAHKFMIYREPYELTEAQEKLLVNELKMTTGEIHMKAEELERAKEFLEQKTYNRLKESGIEESYYVLNETILKYVSPHMSGREARGLFELLKGYSDEEYGMYIREEDDAVVYSSLHNEVQLPGRKNGSDLVLDDRTQG